MAARTVEGVLARRYWLTQKGRDARVRAEGYLTVDTLVEALRGHTIPEGLKLVPRDFDELADRIAQGGQ